MVKNHYLILMSLLILSADVYGQTQSPSDTTKNDKPQSWKHHMPGLRVATGIQQSFYTEVGFVMQKFIYPESGNVGISAYYGSLELSPGYATRKMVYAYKVGYEIISLGAGGGLEIKHQTNGDKKDWVITPKIGLGIGAINLFYGYNISTNKYPFSSAGRHQFSLIFNSNLLHKKTNKSST